MTKSDRLETERLLIFPLNYDQLVSYLKPGTALEEGLELEPVGRSVSTELAEAMRESILPAVADIAKNYLFSTLWTMVSKKDNQMVGDLCFKGEPGDSGEIEIGYGTYNEFQGKGYMTEAIGGMLNWAFLQAGVKAVIAETELSNFASHKTLQNNSFVKYKGVGEMLWWKLEKPRWQRLVNGTAKV